MPATPARPPHKAVRPTPYSRQQQSSHPQKAGPASAASGTAESSRSAQLSAAAAAAAPAAATTQESVKSVKKNKNKRNRNRSSTASTINPPAQHKKMSESPVKQQRAQQDNTKRVEPVQRPSPLPSASAEMEVDGNSLHSTHLFSALQEPTTSASSQQPTVSQSAVPLSQKRNLPGQAPRAVDRSPSSTTSLEKRKKDKKKRELNKAYEAKEAFLKAEREKERNQASFESGLMGLPAADKAFAPASELIAMADTARPQEYNVIKQIKLESALKEQQRALAEETKRRANQELARVREEAKKREETQKELQKLRDQVEQWKAEAEKEKQLKEESQKAMKDMVGKLEKQIEDKRSHNQAQEVVIKDHEATKGALKEAVECGVCLMTVNDPHILSCGHMACKGCMMEWFRTPGAYQSVILDPITPDTDLSHRVKLCHVCRAIVLRRPARVFFVRQILEPLGLYEDRDAPLPTSQLDPWDKIFPIERESYKIYDEMDDVWRCPTCGGEIADGGCTGCGLIFSDIEDEEFDDLDSESDVVGPVLGDGPVMRAFDFGGDFDLGGDGNDFAHADALSRRRIRVEEGRAHRLVDDEAEDDLSDDDDESSESSDIEYRHGRQRRGPVAAPAPLHDRAQMDPHLAGIFNAIDGGAYDRRGGPWGNPEDEPSPPLSSDEDESDAGPPGSEDEYGGSFIDDGEIGEDGGSGYGDVTMFSDEDEDEEVYSEIEENPSGRGRTQRGGPPPRVRRVQSDESDEDNDNHDDDDDNIQPVIHRIGRRRHQPIVISDSE
ncbi:hypothetical protein IAT40_002618 [Kwoniella sp. CBS 6097]